MEKGHGHGVKLVCEMDDNDVLTSHNTVSLGCSTDTHHVQIAPPLEIFLFWPRLVLSMGYVTPTANI